MKRYLYRIEDTYGEPWLPRVFAEKSAKILRRNYQRCYPRRQHYKFATQKACCNSVKDSTPHGYESYWKWKLRKE